MSDPQTADVIDPARSFDRAAEDYERVRPGYPPQVLDLVPLGDDAEVVDLGAGTGKLTRVLAARYRRVGAIEPLDGMRSVLERLLPGVEALAGEAENIPLPDAAFEALFAAQAFHWFANDAAVTEIGRVLPSGGILVVIWSEPNGQEPTPADYNAYLARLHAPSLERIAAVGPWPDLICRGPFDDVGTAYVDHEHVHTREETLAHVQTASWVAHRPEEERARIARDLDAILSDGPFAFRLRTNVMWAVRT